MLAAASSVAERVVDGIRTPLKSWVSSAGDRPFEDEQHQQCCRPDHDRETDTGHDHERAQGEQGGDPPP